MTGNAIAAYLGRLDHAARSASIEEEDYRRERRWSGSSCSNGNGHLRSARRRSHQDLIRLVEPTAYRMGSYCDVIFIACLMLGM